MRVAILILFSSIGLASCDCVVEVKGFVFSNKTNQPVENVVVQLIGRNVSSTSDVEGRFSVSQHTGFCFTPRILVTSTGYKPFEMEIDTDGTAKTFSVHQQLDDVRFEEPFYLNPDNKSTFVFSTTINRFSSNFAYREDSLILYLDEDNQRAEVEQLKVGIKKNRRSYNDR